MKIRFRDILRFETPSFKINVFIIMELFIGQLKYDTPHFQNYWFFQNGFFHFL